MKSSDINSKEQYNHAKTVKNSKRGAYVKSIFACIRKRTRTAYFQNDPKCGNNGSLLKDKEPSLCLPLCLPHAFRI